MTAARSRSGSDLTASHQASRRRLRSGGRGRPVEPDHRACVRVRLPSVVDQQVDHHPAHPRTGQVEQPDHRPLPERPGERLLREVAGGLAVADPAQAQRDELRVLGEEELLERRGGGSLGAHGHPKYTWAAAIGLVRAERREPGAADAEVVAAPGDASCVELGDERQRELAAGPGAVAELRHREAGRVGGEQLGGHPRCGVDRVDVEHDLVALARARRGARARGSSARSAPAGGLRREAAGPERLGERVVGVRVDGIGRPRAPRLDHDAVELGDHRPLALVERGEVEPGGARGVDRGGAAALRVASSTSAVVTQWPTVGSTASPVSSSSSRDVDPATLGDHALHRSDRAPHARPS